MTGYGIRLQKFLAERGVASRRRCENMIAAGRVRVNGTVVTTPGTTVDPARDTVDVDGRDLPGEPASRRTIMLNKPPGYVCSTTSQKAPTVYELLAGIPQRVVPVGRLDKDSEGLLILSDDGALVNELTHPRFGHTKIYHVTVRGTVDARTLALLRSRMVIDGYRIQPAHVEQLACPDKNHVGILAISLREGRNRQIRHMCRRARLQVVRLVRVQIGQLKLGRLQSGQWRDLTPRDLHRLLPAPH